MGRGKEEIAAALRELNWLVAGLRMGGVEDWFVLPEAAAARPAVEPAAMPDGDDVKPTLPDVRQELGDCVRCRLSEARTNIVFGDGSPGAALVFVGEGPGFDEDRQGKPFVGRAGKLLDKMIHAMGFRREEVYICNVVKCRPPRNRTPNPEEIEACFPFLTKQIEAIGPRAICALGAVAAQTLLGTSQPISGLRGKVHSWRGIPLVATYHPAYLLRNPAQKASVWPDLLEVRKLVTSDSAYR